MKDTPTVLQMAESYLKENGYDGLYQSDGCACLLDDLAPCGGEMMQDCQAGYRHSCPGPESDKPEDCEGECDWHVGHTKPGKMKTKIGEVSRQKLYSVEGKVWASTEAAAVNIYEKQHHLPEGSYQEAEHG